MEIISMDIRTFDALMTRVKTIEEKADILCKRQEDLGLSLIHISEPTRRYATFLAYRSVPYRSTGPKDYCLSAGSRTSCSTSLKTWRKYYSRIIMLIQRNYEPLFH